MERFTSKLGPKDPITGCIEWKGSRLPSGYGTVKRDGKVERAHRVAYELKHGPIPDGMCVLHRCDNPPCCNDEHLFLGTHADNVADKVSKGRQARPKGEKCGMAKLTWELVDVIRQRLAAGHPQRDIANDFGVSQKSIGNIHLGKTWQNQKMLTSG